MELNLQWESIKRLFDEARRNTKAKHEKWEKYYNRRRRVVQIKESDEKEIRISSSYSNRLRFKSGKFEGVQPRPNESQYSRKNGSGERRDLEEKGIGLLRRIWSPDHPARRGHNQEDQFVPEETENNSTASTPRSKEGQAAGVPEAEEVSHNVARRGQEERTVEDPSPLKC
ncbi:hypothetical protein TNCV_215361 [Trichonephila clavipes]|nr:hypothetical protein TNCV_215361 [Trichonephila clavipes]